MTAEHLAAAHDVGNREFLDAVFRGIRADEYRWTAQFLTKPNDATAAQWSGLEVTDRYQDRNQNHVGWNHYFCVAALKPAADGRHRRHKDTFSRLFAVVVDDAQIAPTIIPSWILETSHPDGQSNVQVGYLLVDPLDDLDQAVALHKALASAGHLGGDKNGNNPVRYVRLPWGANTKHQPAHVHRMLHWQPDNRIAIADLIAGLGLMIPDRAPPASIQPVPSIPMDTPDGWMPKARKLAWDAARRTHEEPTLGRHAEIYRIGAYAARDGIPTDALDFMLEEFVRMMRPCDTSGVATGVNWDAERKTIKDGYHQGAADGIVAPVDFSGLIGPSRAAKTAAFDALIQDANRRRPDPVLVEESAPQARAFPVHGLDEIAAWVASGASVSYPTITQQAVLCLVSAAVARLYTTPQGDPLSLYLGACARSVGELRYAHHAVSRALCSAGLRRIARSTRMSSPATIYKTMLRSPATVYLADDYGGVASFSKRQPSGLQEHALSLIASLYDGKTVQLDGPEDAGLRAGSAQVSDEQPCIYSPCLSILALIGTDQLATLFRQSETGRGALQQMLIGIGDERTAIEQDPQDLPPPSWLPAYLSHLRRAPMAESGADLNLSDIFGSIAGLHANQDVVRFDCSLSGAYAALDELSTDRRVRSLILASRAIVRRIAACLAAWETPAAPVVTPQIMDWTGAYVVDRMRETVAQFEVLHSSDGKSSVYDTVLARVTETGTKGISSRDLCRECWAYRNLSGDKRGELIELMLADQAITELSVTGKTGRKSKVFVASRFVQEDAE